jgi:hypothetical protein
LRCEALTDPLAIVDARPRLSSIAEDDNFLPPPAYLRGTLELVKPLRQATLFAMADGSKPIGNLSTGISS